MEPSEELDIDSLMELMEDDFDLPAQDLKAPADSVKEPVAQEAAGAVKEIKPRILKDVPLLFSNELEAETENLDAKDQSEIHHGDGDSSDDELYQENKKDLNEYGQMIKRKLSEAANQRYDHQYRNIKTWKDSIHSKKKSTSEDSPDSKKLDFKFSNLGIRIVNPLLPSNVFEDKVAGFQKIEMSDITNTLDNDDIDGDWFTVGVSVQEIPSQNEKTGKKFSIWRMTDLEDCNKIVKLMLTNKAYATHKIVSGMVISLLCPSLKSNSIEYECPMLLVDQPGKLIVLGKSKDFSFCKAIKKDGNACKNIVNLSKCEYCVFHSKSKPAVSNQNGCSSAISSSNSMKTSSVDVSCKETRKEKDNHSTPLQNRSQVNNISGKMHQQKSPNVVTSSNSLFSAEKDKSPIDKNKSTVRNNNLSVNNVSTQNIENNPPFAQTKAEKRVSKLSSPSQESQLKIKTWKDDGKLKNNLEDKSFIVEQYSGIRIMNALVMPAEMKQRMQNRKMIKMSFIRNFIRGGDIEGDWVTLGVVVQKVPPKTSKNGKTFSIWKMTDLHDCEKIVSVFLFGATHTEHWKTSVGTVVGILNPSIMSSKENNEISLSVDNPKKFMIMGTSKDFGHCKARRKDGSSCNVIVNVQQCEFCTYHVKNEYKKFSSKRSAVQSSYSGRGEPCLKNKVLKGQNVFYGGQMFTPPANGKKSSNFASKDKLTLSNLTLKRKAEAVETDEREKGIKKISDIYGPEIAKAASSNSDFINNQLTTPTVGSRNFLRYMVKDMEKKDQKISVITPEELLKIHKKQFENKASQPKQKTDQAILQDLMPKLGRGLNPGQKFNLNVPAQKAFNALTPEYYAKLKAIKKIQQNGPLKKKDPNSIKTSPEALKKVESVLDNSVHSEQDVMDVDEKILSQNSKLGINLDSEKIKEIMSRKSSHSYEVETEEIEREERYFNRLEKKEQMEDKMASTLEIVCDVVSCKQCKYTADHAVDRCKAENHPLKCHKAIKRFFRCKDCSRRTFCYTKLPTKPCRSCGSTNFEKTGMYQPRSGPKLGSENLSICGNDMKFLNSLQSEKSFLHV